MRDSIMIIYYSACCYPRIKSCILLSIIWLIRSDQLSNLADSIFRNRNLFNVIWPQPSITRAAVLNFRDRCLWVMATWPGDVLFIFCRHFEPTFVLFHTFPYIGWTEYILSSLSFSPLQVIFTILKMYCCL